MKKLIVMLIVILATSCLVACGKTVVTKKVDVYSPAIIISGDVEEVFEYMPDSDSHKLGMELFELKDVVDSSKVKGEVDGILVLAHGTKAVYINAESIPYYYFLLSSSGIMCLYSRLSTHSNVGDLPLVSIGEIVIFSKGSESGVQFVTDTSESTLTYRNLLRVYGLVEKVVEAIEEDKFSMSTYNQRIQYATKFLGKYNKCIITLEDGKEVLIKKGSSLKVHWANGGIRFTEEIKTKIIQIRLTNEL